MKSRTSFFNPTVFKKDLTRFAPTWALYTVGLFMMMAVCMDTPYDYRKAENLLSILGVMAVLNLGYGLLNGQLLFGDLFSSRHCNALHAMPLRRECWFFTHVVSGLLFSFGPNLVMSLVAALMMGGGWFAAVLWLLVVTLQYLCFFGLAVLSALCVGNRFAMVLVYSIINFLSLIVYWFYYSIYEPLLYGVVCDQRVFTRLCPVWQLVEVGYDLVAVTHEKISLSIRDFSFGNGWGALIVYAAMGVALLGLALMLYRRRKLESAGDFMAVRALEPVFLGLYTLSMSTFFRMFAELFEQSEYIFLGLGMIVGFFTGLMLIRRTIRVFRPRAILACFLVGVAFAASMVLTAVDPLGVTRYVPKADQVEAVYFYNYAEEAEIIFQDTPGFDQPEEVERALLLQQAILDQRDEPVPSSSSSICITYKMKNGAVIQRYYRGVAGNTEAAELASYFFGDAAFILGGEPEEVLEKLGNVSYYSYQNDHYGDLPAHMGKDLLRAVSADCDAGRMAQHSSYRSGNSVSIGSVDFQYMNDEGMWIYRNITIFSDCYYTIAYLEENVIPWLEANSYE